jgi:hypothetical protein
MKRLIVFSVLLTAGCSPQRSTEQGSHQANGANSKASASDFPPVPFSEIGWDGTRFTYRDAPFTGVTTEHYKDGQLKARYHIRGGLNHGLVEEWYENGRQKTKTTYEDGRHQGDNFYWNSDGTLQAHKVWKDDVLISESHPDKQP